MEKVKLAIIGASYLQEPLIQKAKKRGIETHVFAWGVGDVGEKSADYFYPISIIEKDEILKKCLEIGIDGICTIASDLAVITVGYVAEKMGLIGNDMSCVEKSTNKHLMRKCFEKNGDPSPKSLQVYGIEDVEGVDFAYPLIVKPVDRSGSRGITELNDKKGLEDAINRAIGQGFKKCALVEEFVFGQEYSVEYLSWNGEHTFLALTKKYTTGAPDFIETGHIEPALVSDELLNRIQRVVSHALDSLGIKYGASHSEIKITPEGGIYIIEIGGRMGGDNIGASLVQLSTGFDFLNGVIDVALGIEPQIFVRNERTAGIHFVFNHSDLDVLESLKKNNPEILISEDVHEITKEKVVDSSSRFGYFMFADTDYEKVAKYMPQNS